MSGMPPSQAAGEGARVFQRGIFRPGKDGAEKTRTSAVAAGASGGDGASPSHLVVLVHGLAGTPEDLSYLKESLDRRGGPEILVHLARCNQGKTKDGVAMGGERLANEVLAVVASTPSLSRISLVGNSLGGLYVRYAVKLLYDAGGVGAGDASATPAAELVVGSSGFNGSRPTNGSVNTAATATATATTKETEAEIEAATALVTGASSTSATAAENSTTSSTEASTETDTEKASVPVTEPAAAGDGRTRSAPKDEGKAPMASSSPTGGGEKAATAAGGGETVAGLKPSVFMTIASPHLGVRCFTYVPLPTPLHSLASVFVGKTGSDLFLKRNGKGSDAFPPPPPPPPSGPSLSPSAIRGAVQRWFSLSPGDAGGEAVGNGPWVGSGSPGGTGASAGGGAGVGAGREASLLYEMATSEEFLRPLKAFRWRRAYANRRGDFMVPYGTAAFVSPGEGDGSETVEATTATPATAVVARGAGTRRAGAEVGSGLGPTRGGDGRGKASQEVDTGATASEFTLADRVLGAKHGAIVGMARVPAGPAAGSGSRDGGETGAEVGAATRSGDNGSGGELRSEGGGEAEAAGTGAVAARVAVAASERPVRPGRTRIFIGSKASARMKGKKTMEEEMADGLNSCGWDKVSVDFGGLAPFSHNKICALSRSPLTRAVFRSGKTVVDHAANFLVSYDLKEDLGNVSGGGSQGR